ncbi:MAG: hypothetical protein WCK09_10590 [Bacteroidota bacterium]
MELLFNELSVITPSSDKYAANAKMKLFSETVAAAKLKGFRNIRSHYDSHQIELAGEYTLFNWLTSRDVPELYRNNLYGMFVLPFIDEEDEDIETKYIEANFFFEDPANGIARTACLGLASAYLYETISIGLQSQNAWRKNILTIFIEANDTIRFESVNNVYSKDCFDNTIISDFVEQSGNVVLQESLLAPNDKDIHIADHHGKDELKSLWNKLKNNPYVVAGRSTDWGGRRFIRKFDRNGVVEIVLVASEREYALWVQTTGRSLRETKAIADALRDRFE